jgi:hypothetical protein
MKFLLTILLFISAWAIAETNLEILARLVKDESYGKVIQVFEKPTHETTISAGYKFDEMKIRPNEILYFLVPERLSGSAVSQVGFGHRQDGRKLVDGERDSNPAITSALVYDKTKVNDELRYWAGHSSGKFGGKFAEYRKRSEFDALYEWPIFGSKGVVSRDKTKELVYANAIRIQNTGTDDLYFNQLYLEVMPTVGEEYQEIIFTPKSDFGDVATMRGRYYGGGQVLKGTFPNALRIDSKGHRHYPTLPANMMVDKNKIYIELTVGKKLSSVEVMCGDTYPDMVPNKDKGWGTLGNAKLSIYLENMISSEKRMLLEEKNVGPQGVISASEVDSQKVIAPGDRLVIENKRGKSTAHIMGIRIGINTK